MDCELDIKDVDSCLMIDFGINNDRSWVSVVMLPENIATLISYTLHSELWKQMTQVHASWTDWCNKTGNNCCINRLVSPVNKLIAYGRVIISLWPWVMCQWWRNRRNGQRKKREKPTLTCLKVHLFNKWLWTWAAVTREHWATTLTQIGHDSCVC